MGFSVKLRCFAIVRVAIRVHVGAEILCVRDTINIVAPRTELGVRHQEEGYTSGEQRDEKKKDKKCSETRRDCQVPAAEVRAGK